MSPVDAISPLETAKDPRRRADQCAGRRWLAYMLDGDFEAAWKESDAIRVRGRLDPHRLWDGTSLDGQRAIVRCLHGLGDAIQFLRYAGKLRRLVRELVVEVPPPLLELGHCIDGIESVVSWGDCAPDEPVEWDKQIEVMELPYYFRTVLSELPVAERYVHVSDETRMRVERIMGPSHGPRIGMVWAAGDWNRGRSLPFDQLAPLLASHGFEFWNLQGGSEHDAWKALPAEGHLRDGLECGHGLLTLAALIGEMDVVITVDTLAAHLAGAMGKLAWVLLEHAADWRWMTNRSNSPWYPSLRLFRQPAEKDWGGLVSLLSDELHCYLQRSKASRSGRCV